MSANEPQRPSNPPESYVTQLRATMLTMQKTGVECSHDESGYTAPRGGSLRQEGGPMAAEEAEAGARSTLGGNRRRLGSSLWSSDEVAAALTVALRNTANGPQRPSNPPEAYVTQLRATMLTMQETGVECSHDESGDTACGMDQGEAGLDQDEYEELARAMDHGEHGETILHVPEAICGPLLQGGGGNPKQRLGAYGKWARQRKSTMAGNSSK